MSITDSVEKRYMLIITTFIGIIGFLIGGGASAVISDNQINAHKELTGHPLTVQKIVRLEEENKEIKIALKSINDKLTVILINQEKFNKSDN